MKIIRNGEQLEVGLIKNFIYENDNYVIYKDPSGVCVGKICPNGIVEPDPDSVPTIMNIIDNFSNAVPNKKVEILTKDIDEIFEELSYQNVNLSVGQLYNLVDYPVENILDNKSYKKSRKKKTNGNVSNNEMTEVEKRNTLLFPIIIFAFIIIILIGLFLLFGDDIFGSSSDSPAIVRLITPTESTKLTSTPIIPSSDYSSKTILPSDSSDESSADTSTSNSGNTSINTNTNTNNNSNSNSNNSDYIKTTYDLQDLLVAKTYAVRSTLNGGLDASEVHEIVAKYNASGNLVYFEYTANFPLGSDETQGLSDSELQQIIEERKCIYLEKLNLPDFGRICYVKNKVYTVGYSFTINTINAGLLAANLEERFLKEMIGTYQEIQTEDKMNTLCERLKTILKDSYGEYLIINGSRIDLSN